VRSAFRDAWRATQAHRVSTHRPSFLTKILHKSAAAPTNDNGPLKRKKRLGGMLSYDNRAAA
jgi:hypothetical protein